METPESVIFHAAKVKDIQRPKVTLEKTVTVDAEGKVVGEESLETREMEKVKQIIERTHTLLFKVVNNGVYATWSKPHTVAVDKYGDEYQLDVFCKAIGRGLAEKRMDHLEKEAAAPGKELIMLNDIKGLGRYMPTKVAKSFSFYAQKALRYLKKDNVQIVFRGLRNDSEPGQSRTAICVIDSANLN